jgi:glyoxylase-like metal-dependent hydrolase (beta-lactamase superfamily II)
MSASPDTPQRVAIREDWGTAVEVEPGLFRLRLVNPRGTLLINTYIYKSPGHLAVIDPGWPWTLDGLQTALADLGLGTLAEVDQWLYTHTHIDHMGLAAILADHSDAPHYAWSAVEAHLPRWHAFQDQMNDWFDWGKSAFAEPWRSQLIAQRERQRAGQRKYSSMAHQYGERGVENAVLFELGETLQIGDLKLNVYDARGHDPYHVAFHEPELKWLFVGDVVIATPTPISRSMDDDLAQYRESLDRLQALDTALLLPGHGVQKSDRIDAAFARSRGFVDSYTERVLAVLAKHDAPVDLHTIALDLTPDGKPLAPEPRWWVHVALVDSHLNLLVNQASVQRHDGPRYELSQ